MGVEGPLKLSLQGVHLKTMLLVGFLRGHARELIRSATVEHTLD
jgi:hypothetical protein